jgi:hypothetical protein
MTTLAPSPAKRAAVARPIPLAAPVITATFPSSLPMISPPFGFYSSLHAQQRFPAMSDLPACWRIADPSAKLCEDTQNPACGV